VTLKRGAKFDVRERIFARTVPAGDCLIWTGAKDRQGRGVISYYRRLWKAHRVVWTEVRGPIPPGLEVCHRCDNGPCVNPGHLFLGTHAENMADMRAKGRHRPQPGELNGRAKLTADQARQIRSSSEPTRTLVRRYGITRTVVQRIRNGRLWAQLCG
jgi:Autographiviridae endonuclease